MKVILYIVGVVVVIIIAAGIIISKQLPEGYDQERADEVAHNILARVDSSAWRETQYFSWELFGHQYVWDQTNNYASIRWDDIEVLMVLDSIDGIAMQGGEEVLGDEKQKILDKAWSFWTNDSFWFMAYTKLFDTGTIREMVKIDGRECLKVTYTTGGTTPGDSYVWHYDEEYLPEAFQMWVSVLPVNGIKVRWAEWHQTETGVWVAGFRGRGDLGFEVKNIRGVDVIPATEHQPAFHLLD